MSKEDSEVRLATALDRLERHQTWSIYAHPYKFLLFSFLQGLMLVLGSTLGVALVLYLLSWLGYLPFLGDVFENLRATVAGYQ